MVILEVVKSLNDKIATLLVPYKWKMSKKKKKKREARKKIDRKQK